LVKFNLMIKNLDILINNGIGEFKNIRREVLNGIDNLFEII